MPLYEYECFLCHRRFERIQRVSDAPVSECPSCGGAVRRLLGVPALQFKGSGFYITDYGKGSGGGSSRSHETSKEESKPAAESKETPNKETKPTKTDSGGKDKKSA
jgi:putative FmdB family regulatory protein